MVGRPLTGRRPGTATLGAVPVATPVKQQPASPPAAHPPASPPRMSPAAGQELDSADEFSMLEQWAASPTMPDLPDDDMPPPAVAIDVQPPSQPDLLRCTPQPGSPPAAAATPVPENHAGPAEAVPPVRLDAASRRSTMQLASQLRTRFQTPPPDPTPPSSRLPSRDPSPTSSRAPSPRVRSAAGSRKKPAAQPLAPPAPVPRPESPVKARGRTKRRRPRENEKKKAE